MDTAVLEQMLGEWRVSLDDRFIDHETGVGLDGSVWGVKWHALYPGAKLAPESEAARRWAEALGIDTHEVRMETHAHNVTLLFSDRQVLRKVREARVRTARCAQRKGSGRQLSSMSCLKSLAH